MSTEQSIDPHLLEQTKQQIRALVNEIAQLAKSDVSPGEFYGEFLPRVVSALAAIGGAVWVAEAQGRLALGYQINLQETRLRDDQEGQVRHGRLLHKVLTSGEGSLVPPQSGAGDDDQGGNPTNFLLVLAPLKAADDIVGVVEIFQRPETRPATQKGYLRFLVEMCDRAGEFFKTHQLKHFTDRQALWTQLEDFTRGVHASLDPRDTAYTIANDGRRLIECDRVSVAIRRGNRCVIESVSGQDLFDKRSNTVRLLGRLATAVVASGEPVWYTGDTSNIAPQVEDALQEYVDESHSKTVAVLPLARPLPPEEAEEDPDKRPDPEPPVGALIVEQIEDSRVPEKMIQRVEVVSQHSSTALANALEHNSLFLMPLWRTLGKARWLVKARTLPKTVLVAGLILILVLVLIFVPYQFNVSAKGTLEPVQRRDVYADFDGRVAKVFVRQGQEVQEGEVLALLENTDLDLAIEDVLGELATTEKEINRVNRERSRAISDPAQQSQVPALSGRLAELMEKRRSLESQHELQLKRKALLTVESPMTGEVGTWDVDKLMRYPAQRGQKLMWIFNPDGDWQLELLMPDRRMGDIVQRQLEEHKKALPVVFILATDPGTKYEGKIEEVDLSAEVRRDEGNTVLIKVKIADDVKKKLEPLLRRGVGVTAKIDCGQRSLGYVLLHDVIAFVQSKILFRWF